jgi:beta-lactamase class A
MIDRRNFSSSLLFGLAGMAAATASCYPAKSVASEATPTQPDERIGSRLKEIERSSQGRLGVFILDPATGAGFGHRADERFLMCSTFKFMASAVVLRRVDRGEETLARRVPFSAADLLPNSPITTQHAASGSMTMGELCKAAITYSDNTAANLILASYGGPPEFTAFARSIGDKVTRLDRIEPVLNIWKAGDERDTTSPRAMAVAMQQIVLGDALSPASREQMRQWLLANTTGDHRLKAHLPKTWHVGDKTGTGDAGSTNDIGVIWPPNRAPLVVATYLTECKVALPKREEAIAQVGKLLTTIVG